MAFFGSASIDLQREPVRVDGLSISIPVQTFHEGTAARAPVVRGRLPGDLYERDERLQRLLDVRLERDLHRIVLADVPVGEADLHDRHALGQRLDLAVHRHAQRIGAEHDHEVVGRQHFAHLGLRAGERAHEPRAFREEVRAVGHRLLVRRAAERFGERRGLGERVALHELVAGDEDGLLRLADAPRERLRARRRRAASARRCACAARDRARPRN